MIVMQSTDKRLNEIKRSLTRTDDKMYQIIYAMPLLNRIQQSASQSLQSKDHKSVEFKRHDIIMADKNFADITKTV